MKTYGWPNTEGRITAVTRDGAAPGPDWIELPDGAQPDQHYVVDGALVAFTDIERASLRARPHGFAHWDQSLRAWTDLRTLEERKRAKWIEVKRAMRASEQAGFTLAGVTYDSDTEAQQQISLTLQDMTGAGGPPNVVWLDANGTPVSMNMAQMRALARALREHIATQRAKGADLRSQINAAPDADALDAIVW